METVIAKGDLAQLTAEQRVAYYKAMCESLGLNPLTRPFQYITLNGRLTLYAAKDATDQLRKLHSISIVKLEREKMDGLYVVTATAQLPDGRQDSSIGAVNIEGLKGDALANAMMKGETKGKRRVTLSICGLGWTDESEIETIPGAQLVQVDTATGEVHWSDKVTRGQPWSAAWLIKQAERTSLTTVEIEQLIGDLHQYATYQEAVSALDKAIAEAQGEPQEPPAGQTEDELTF